MNELKLLWTDIGGVQFRGSRGIIRAWADEMESKGWIIETHLERWRDCDLIFLGSDSQLSHMTDEMLQEKPSILYFWGWMAARLLDRNFQQIAQRQLEKMAKCTRILVPSLITMDQAADFGLPSYLCLPGVDSRLLDGDEREYQRKVQVMFLSRLVPHKHLDAIIEAVSLIDPPPGVLVCGPGDNRAYMEMAQRLNVKAEFVELEDIEKVTALREATVLVHPSSYEGFGLPPLEALYCGTPVIVYDIPQSRWLLQEDAYYFSSVEGLAQSIVHVLKNYDEAIEKAAHGASRIRENLTLQSACDRLWAHIHQVIKEFLARKLRTSPGKWAEIYDDEHRRNWAYSLDRFDPTWGRHWRAQAFIDALKECGAKRILDVGCGAVYPTIFARAGFEVYALDISQECLNQVFAIAEKWGVLNQVHGYLADANDLSQLPMQEFDAVVQGEIWEHVPDVEKVISEGLRVLRPGGYLIVTSPIGEHHYDPMHMRVFDDQSIQALVGKFQVDGVAKVKRLDMIAEEGAEPSCYLIVMEKV